MAIEAVRVSRYRRLPRILNILALLATATAIVVAVLNIFHIIVFGLSMVEATYFFMIIGTLLPLTFLYFPAGSKFRDKVPWYDILFAATCFGICLYFALHWNDILFSGWEVQPPPLARALGFIILLLVIEAVRRTTGLFLAIFIIFFCVYPLFAIHMPGPLMAKNYSLTRMIGYLVIGPEGLIGLPIRVFSQIFVGFMMFGVVLMHTGAARFFLDISLVFLGMVRGGTAKVAVVSSAFMGSVSGSAMANVITTGSFTIPAMKRAGYPSHYAGAVECCASTGGVIMPPIMGAAAFVMAEFLNVPYSRVALGAAIPSILYYTGLFIQADGFAAKKGLSGLPHTELPSLRKTFKRGWFFLFAFAVLIYTLFFLRLEAQSPFYASAVLVILAMINKKTRFDRKRAIEFLQNIGQVLSELVGILAAIGLLIGSLFLTGVAQTLSSELIRLAHGNLPLLVAFAAISSFFLGMGLTITACYVLLAILVAPTLVQMGIPPFAAHFFLLYCGNLSNITPPVALAAYAAAPIAHASPIRIGYQAMRLGTIIFILPFLFLISPTLVLIGSPSGIAQYAFSCLVGVVLLSSVIEGYLVFIGKLNMISRIFIGASSALFFYPIWYSQFIGVGVTVLLVFFLRRFREG